MASGHTATAELTDHIEIKTSIILWPPLLPEKNKDLQ